VATGKELRQQGTALNGPPELAPRGFPESWEDMVMARVIFSPDGRLLAMNRWQKTIPVWEAWTGAQRLLLEGHTESTACLAFSPDGRTLASAGWDETVRLWDLDTGKELRVLKGHRGKVNSLAFAADGRTLASAGDDTTVLFWDVAAVTGRERPRDSRLAPAELEGLWADLAAADGGRAHKAIVRLAAARPALALLSERLRPASARDEAQVARLLRSLDSDQYAVRARASRELEQMGEEVRPALEKALARAEGSLELRRRVGQLLERLEVPSGDRLRKLRALEVLERIGTLPTQQLLKALAAGTPEARVTQEARAALQRLARRPGSQP
jgi:hypothetical protein